MIKLERFTEKDFELFIAWADTKELLVTIAGNYFSYPLTAEQLHAYLRDEKSYPFSIVDTEENRTIGHAELVISDENTFKIDKLIIGDQESRGKGLCGKIMNALVEYAFTQLNAVTVELNVFDWNSAAIRCYEKAGFIVNPGKTETFKVDSTEWVALNMILENQK